MKRENNSWKTDILEKCISLLASYDVALWKYNCSTGDLFLGNNYLQAVGLEQTGISFSDINGFKPFIHPDDLPAFDKAFEKAIGGSNTNVTYRCISPSGDQIWLEDHFFVYPEENETPEVIIGCTKNVTERVEKEAIQRKDREKYYALQNAMAPNFVFIFTKDFYFHDVIFPEGLRLFHKPEDIIGTDARAIYSPEVSELFIQNIEKSLQTNKLISFEYHVDLVGKRFYYQANIVPYEGDKGFALIQDISDRIRRINDLVAAREKAEEADKMKSAFLANMSHEIRTPLNAIVGFSEVIAENNIDAQERVKFQNIIRSNNDLLLKLINDILDLSRIESGKSEIIAKDTHLSTLFDEIKESHLIRITPTIDFDVIYPSVDLWMDTDPDRVKQILNNFLSNAFKNTKQGTVTLGIEKGENEIRFFVSDTGCGIPEEKLDKIFHRFEKVNSFVQGTGLGLPICSTLAHRLGGDITVKSKLGEGSTFTLHIPYDPQDTHAKKRIATIPKRKRPVVLIAENSTEEYNYAYDILQKDYDIVQAPTGKEVIDLFIQETPNLILMNIQLPVIDGLKCAKRIREFSSSVPIIGFTSQDFYYDQKNAMECGYSDVISKPYSATKLREMIVAFI